MLARPWPGDSQHSHSLAASAAPWARSRQHKLPDSDAGRLRSRRHRQCRPRLCECSHPDSAVSLHSLDGRPAEQPGRPRIEHDDEGEVRRDATESAAQHWIEVPTDQTL